MEYKQITCREHGGQFMVPVKRGRPPVRCSEDNVCAVAKKTSVNGGRRPTHTNMAAVTAARVATKRLTKAGPEEAPTVVRNNPSVPFAFAAKKALEPQGWKVSGTKDDAEMIATVVATRGTETITLMWRDGKLIDQRYSLWDTDKPVKNGMPKRRLNFIPEVMSDQELIRELVGYRITWWNALGKTTETAVVPNSRVKVEHVFSGVGMDEVEDDRMITFVDAAGTGFRSLRIGALLKVG